MSPSFSEEVQEYFDADKRAFVITHRVLIYLICAVGILGNMVSFSVLSRPEFKSSVNCCLQFLSVFDTLVLSFYIVMTEAVTVPRSILVFLFAALQASVWTTMMVSLERFIAVCYPLKARFLCTYKKTLLCNIATAILSVSLNIPRVFVSKDYEINENISLHLFLNTRFKSENSTLYLEGYGMSIWEIHLAKSYSWMEITLVYFVPFLAIIYCNIRIYRAIKEAEVKRREMSQHQQKEINIAKTVLCVVIVFFITGSPWLVFKFTTHYGLVSLLQYVKFLYMLNPLVVSNSAANFMIYFAVNREFRRTLIASLKNSYGTVRTFLGVPFPPKRKVPNIYIIENTRL